MFQATESTIDLYYENVLYKVISTYLSMASLQIIWDHCTMKIVGSCIQVSADCIHY